MDKILVVSDLWIDYVSQGRSISAVRGVSFSLTPGSILGIVGESGSGKSSLGLAIMKLLPKYSETKGSIRFMESELTKIPKERMPDQRGTGMTMIFQEPMTSLNPVMRVADQLAEAINIRRERNIQRVPSAPEQLHSYDQTGDGGKAGPMQSRMGMRKSRSYISEQTRREIIQVLKTVRITDPERTSGKYPHELSGGERQRVMISIAYLLKPKLLIADEPTTALDVTTQAQILRLMLELREQIGTSIMFVSHDLLVVGQVSDRIAVMYAGEIVELATAQNVFTKPMHPYTQGLLNSIPSGYNGEGRVNPIPQPSQGEIPQLVDGCKFHTRCRQSFDRCSRDGPKLKEVEEDHYVSCHLY